MRIWKRPRRLKAEKGKPCRLRKTYGRAYGRPVLFQRKEGSPEWGIFAESRLCGVARLSDGTIAGSATDLYTCMQNAVKYGISVEEAVLAATLNPAKAIGCQGEIGAIAPGKRADFVVCDEGLNSRQVYLAGEPV